jgi:hypothetical protein
MRVELSQRELDFYTTSSSHKKKSPMEVSSMDEDYDYNVESSSLSQPKTFQEYQLRGEAPPPPPPSRAPASDEEEEVRNESEDALLDLAQLEELHQEAERMKALGNKHMASQVSYKFPYVLNLNFIFIRSFVKKYIMAGIYSSL